MISGRLVSFSACIFFYGGTAVEINSDNVRGSRRARQSRCSTQWGRLGGIMSEAIYFPQCFVVETHDLGEWDQTRFQRQKGSPS